ncbi:MAG: GrpB family protein [Acidimicrobiales bacterium]
MTGPDDLDDELERVLIGGRERRTIRIERYSDDWPRRFERERKRIEVALGPIARRIEHVGSTAVPGLAAKPVIDIMVTVDDPDHEAALVDPMEQAGYRLRVRERGHRMFRTPERDVHIHVWAVDSDNERRDLLFRDWLRAHPSDRLEYERAKFALAGEWPDMNYYARAKGPVIARILERATGLT